MRVLSRQGERKNIREILKIGRWIIPRFAAPEVRDGAGLPPLERAGQIVGMRRGERSAPGGGWVVVGTGREGGAWSWWEGGRGEATCRKEEEEEEEGFGEAGKSAVTAAADVRRICPASRSADD